MAHTEPTRYRLDNGLTVLLAPHRLAPVVALQAWVRVGSADEPERLAGMAHVFEHMLFKGTARRGVGEIAQAVESAGGDINAWTSLDQTVYHVVLASRYFETGLDVLADALQSSAFDADELEREREVILEEIHQSRDDPARSVAQRLFATAYRRHAYRRPVLGTPQTVRALTRSDVVAFFRRWYVAGNVVLVVAGDFDPAAARRSIAARLGRMPAGTPRRRRLREPAQTELRVDVGLRDTSEVYLTMGFHIPTLRARDTAALDVAAIALGQGESSRLSRALRRERELVAGVHAYAHLLRDPGMFLINAVCRPEHLDSATEAASHALFALAHEELSADEIEKARHAVEADSIYQLETAQGLARKLGYYECLAADAGFEAVYVDRIRRVTAAEVRAAAARHFAPDAATVAALVPREPGRAKARADAHARTRLARSLAAQVRKGARRARSRPARATPAARPGPDLVREVLPSGARVIVKRDPSVPVVAMRAVWMGGLRAETPRTNGVSHFIASLLTRGCGPYSAPALVQRVDDIAGSLAGVAGRNSLGLRAEWLARDWREGLDLLAACVLSPHFEAVEIERERRRILDDLRARDDNPGFVAFRAFAEAMYSRHPYRMDVLGTPQVVSALTRDELVEHYRRTFPVSGLTLAIVGDVDPAQVVGRARALLGREPRVEPPAPSVAAEVFTGRPASEREVYRYLDRNQAHLVVGFPGTTFDDPDRYALEVLATILGGQGGRLFVELRDRRALAYRVSAFSVEGVDPGYFAVYIACTPDKLAAALTGIRAELTAVVDRPVTKRELDRAVRYLIGTHDISLQGRSAQASALAFHEAYGLGYEAYRRYPARVRAVTAADVQRVAARYIDWSAAVTATVMPPALTPGAARRARGVVRRKPRASEPGARRRDR